MKMMTFIMSKSLNESEKRAVIRARYENDPSIGAKGAFRAVKNLNISRATVYRIWKKLENGEDINRKPIVDRKPLKMTKKKVKELIKLMDGAKYCSFRKAAKKFNTSESNIRRICKIHGIKSFKRQKAPKSSLNQENRQIERLKHLTSTKIKKGARRHIIYDDEAYFGLFNENHSGEMWYHSSDKSKVDPKVKFRLVEKFPTKMMIWLAISKKGISKPYFHEKKNALDGKTYGKECIEKKLIPFIQKNYPKGRYLFWPDGARCHYAKDVLAILRAHGVEGNKFIEKDENPPNMPQIRPIEKFWYQLRCRVYENGWEANDLIELRKRIESKLKTFSLSDIKRLFRNNNEKIHAAAKNGPLSVINC